MSSLEIALRRLCDELADVGVRFALIGGLAVSVRSEPRFTRDADIVVVADDDARAEKLVQTLVQRGYTIAAVIEQEAVGRLATVRLQPSDDSGRGIVLDILFASSGIEAEVVDDAERLEVLPGVTLPVARIGHLIALKVLSRDDRERPQDIVDLRALLPRAQEQELDRARESLRLIEARGFHRQRDLMSMLDELLAKES